MAALGIALWILGLILAIAQGLNIRQKARREQAREHTYEVHAFLLAVAVVLIPVLALSPLHLLWMIPSAFVLGLASVFFPLNLLWLPASVYGSIWYIGTRDSARAAYVAGDYQEAIHLYEQRLQDSESGETWFGLALACEKAGERERAIEAYREALRLEPSSYTAHLNVGRIHLDRGDVDDAMADFRAAIAIKPDYEMGHFNLGLAHLKAGDAEGALRQHEVLRERNPAAAAELNEAIRESLRVEAPA